MKTVKKAVIPCAGYGTRFLPVTKAVPKEMLPIVDTPSIDYIVEECVNSGITEICILVSRGKEAILNHFDINYELEDKLKKKGSLAEIKLINKFLGKVDFSFIRQPEMKGTGNAVKLCRSFTGGEPFAVLFGDDVMYTESGQEPVTKQLITAYDKTGATIVGVQELPKEKALNYGVVVPGQTKGRYIQLNGFKEKPKSVQELPSSYCGLGRFVLTPDIYEYIDKTPMAGNGEIYLPTAIELMCKVSPVFAFNFEGKRYDIGDKLGFIQANIEYALRNPELAKELRDYLKTVL
ncbi:MAG: UTP--glucose-1-phosphate uridylyltransferase [Firmicutes bacterium]|nr:UTP--glucose-1-phosphate uridylyltransferase [Bacillota bacterium]